MPHPCLSLLDPAPPGFMPCDTLKARDVRRGVFALAAASPQAAEQALAPWLGRIDGLIVTLADRFVWERRESGLYHVAVTPEVLPSLPALLPSWLDLADAEVRQREAGRNGRLELQRMAEDRLRMADEFAGFRKSLLAEIQERRNTERALRDSELQMQQAQKLESLGVLAGGIAHDFNNLLLVILGNADLALSELSAVAPAREHLDGIVTASRRAADLCSQMLAYAGKGRIRIQSIGLNEVVSEMTHMLEVTVLKKAVLRFNFAAHLPAVEADASQMRQIIMNLVINAAEAIGERSGMVTISTGSMFCDRRYLGTTFLDTSAPEGEYVFIEVSDTGCGMTHETMGRMFDPFFTTKFAGRGLGLAAVLGIIRSHRGAIKVYSEPGKGTTFKVLLPATAAPVESVVAEPAGGHWRGRGTLLLVDDEEAIRTTAARMLETIGFDVLMAADGREALGVFDAREAGGIAGIILDLNMPRMSGEETYRELCKRPRTVPVIISSGYSEDEIVQRFLGKGVAAVIQKPYQIATLRQKLRTVFEA